MQPRLASIVLVSASLLAAPALAQERCDCAATSCAPMTEGGATVRGRVVEAEGRDANGRLERFFALVPARPVCAEVPGQENASRRTPTRADRVQLVLTNAALRALVQRAVGREVTLRGTLFERITAHHHTPLLLHAGSAVEESPDAGAGRAGTVSPAPACARCSAGWCSAGLSAGRRVRPWADVGSTARDSGGASTPRSEAPAPRGTRTGAR